MLTHTINIDTTDGKRVYILYLDYKRIKSIIFRLKEDEPHAFRVSLPYGTRLSYLESLFKKRYAELLRLEKSMKKPPFGDYTFVFGKRIRVTDLKSQYNIEKNPHNLTTFYEVFNDILYAYIQRRVRFFERKMKIDKPYNIKIKTMKTRWGSNSKRTMTLAMNEMLIHFSPYIIDALIVHELAHYFIRGHGQDFYAYLETIIPHYKYFDKLLKEHHYECDYKPPKS